MARPWKIAAMVVLAAGLGEVGHLLFERFAWAGHHAFHLAFPIVAAGVFVAYVARDVRRHGLPGFSWRLRPDEPAPREEVS